jgi:hypothetical protein
MLYAIAEAYRSIFGAPVHETIVDGILHQAFLVGDGVVELSFHHTMDKMMMSMVLSIVPASVEVGYDVILKDNIVTFRLALSKGELDSEEVALSAQLPCGVHPIKVFLPGKEGPVPSFLNLSEEQHMLLKEWTKKLMGSM